MGNYCQCCLNDNAPPANENEIGNDADSNEKRLHGEPEFPQPCGSVITTEPQASVELGLQIGKPPQRLFEALAVEVGSTEYSEVRIIEAINVSNISAAENVDVTRAKAMVNIKPALIKKTVLRAIREIMPSTQPQQFRQAIQHSQFIAQTRQFVAPDESRQSPMSVQLPQNVVKIELLFQGRQHIPLVELLSERLPFTVPAPQPCEMLQLLRVLLGISSSRSSQQQLAWTAQAAPSQLLLARESTPKRAIAKPTQHSTQPTLEDMTNERDSLQSKVERLEHEMSEHEMSELKSSGTHSDSDLLQLRSSKHELERALADREADVGDLQQEVHELGKKLKHHDVISKALQKDKEDALCQLQGEASRQLSLISRQEAQLEDLHCQITSALKGKQSLKASLLECQLQLENGDIKKTATETRLINHIKESQLMENKNIEFEKELEETNKGWKALIMQNSVTGMTVRDQAEQISLLTNSSNKLQEKLDSVSSKLAHLEYNHGSKERVAVLESKHLEVMQRLSFESSLRVRFENKAIRSKKNCERLEDDMGKLVVRLFGEERRARQLQTQLSKAVENQEVEKLKTIEETQLTDKLRWTIQSMETHKAIYKAKLNWARRRLEFLEICLEHTTALSDDEYEELPSDSEDGNIPAINDV